MRIRLGLPAIPLLLFAAAAAAQNGGTIAGTVKSDAGLPLANVEIVASADNARTMTDSAGHFEIHNLDAGFYTVRARRIGYLQARVTTDLGKNGRADLTIELKIRPAALDTVVVVANGKCPERSIVGFLCRKNSGKGVYMTDDDIFDKNAREIGDIFRGIPGFRIEMASTPFGRLPIPLSTRASQCLNALVNGLVSGPTNPIPRYADEMVALEIYASPADVPEEYQQFVWGRQGRQTQTYHDHAISTTDRCSLVVYWTRLS
jgi:hypothetical protein